MTDRDGTSTSRSAPSPEIDAYLAALAVPQREALQSLRRTIRAAAPEALEAISYALPAFKYHGRPLVSFGAAKKHCSLYCMSTVVMDEHREVLAAFDTSKGTIRFTPDRPLPADLVETLVRARMKETDEASSGSPPTRRPPTATRN